MNNRKVRRGDKIVTPKGNCVIAAIIRSSAKVEDGKLLHDIEFFDTDDLYQHYITERDGGEVIYMSEEEV